ncbi:MAG TPA: deoxyribonuclease V [Candidatus Paceibacterota bacterium]|nr:deoxyribonuclease V [Candidatus Paceibacterota bacterium]HSA03189.1 deoxyribonuclease V [Candidatus Paceibacterota bacterium]
MLVPNVPHAWNLTPREARLIQEQMACRVLVQAPTSPIRWIAGLDAAFSRDGRFCRAAVVLWDLEEGSVVEQHLATHPVLIPYIPGLLSFRETPALLAALACLRQRPDLILCDGQGLAHPRRFGLACHVGVICDLPAVGCAKSLLVGDYDTPGASRGCTAPLLHRQEHVGEVVRTRSEVKPVFVSVGHRMDLSSAVDLVLSCAKRYRLPEPTRLADRYVARFSLSDQSR